jgi:hypothetical protein
MANQISVNTGTGNQQVTVTSTGNIQVTTSRAVIGTVANVASANYANYAGQVTGANQSNITTVGTLGNLTVANTITTKDLIVTGNFSVGNLVANNANYSNFAGVAFNVAGANVSGIVANANYATNSGLATYATTANSVAGANVSGYVSDASHANVADTANSVSGSNVSGAVGLATYATTANSVAVANVSGIGNIAITNYDGNGSNILHGNGFWGPEIGPQSVANANYANFAGTAYSVSGSNVTGAVGLATYATTANSVAGANVAGDVSGANHANIADIANSVAGSNVSGAVGLATYATTANAVAGANVSGIVANANYSAYANIAATANSVAVANVSGIGNIAVINLDGNASNILYGNGVFGPDVGPQDVANANYANFAGTAYSVSGANVSGQVANANFASYANLSQFVNVQIANSSFTSYRVGLVDWLAGGHRVEADGNLIFNASTHTLTTDNLVANANVSANYFIGSGNNLSNIQGSNVSGAVSLATYATTANAVAGANVSGEVANANYATYSGTAYSVSGSNVSGDVSGANHANIADTANSVAGANVSGQVGNALIAGTVYTNAQPNITSTGNLVSLTINNGNVTLPTKQFNPTGVDVGSNANITLMANSSFVDVDYGNGQGGGNLRFGKTTSYVKARGNSSAIATAAVNDVAGRTNYMFYNGTSNVLAAATQTNVTTFNANANAITTAGQYQIITGNPSGDQGNANALSNQNLYTFDSAGRLSITAGAAGGAGSILLLNTYGGTGGGNAAASQGAIFTRTRGNRDSNLSVQPNDQLGYFSFLGHNGTSLFTTRSASLQALVDNTYVANATAIPAGFKLTSTSSTAQNDNWFYANGNVRLGLQSASNTAFTTGATVFVNNLDATANIAGANVSVNTSGFMKLSSYTKAALTAITGSIGWIAAVSDSASGGNPDGMIAFWDSTNSRWSYVHDNSAV